VTQAIDVQLREPVRQAESRAGPEAPAKSGKSAKDGTDAKATEGNARAETARNGSSFLAIIEKMVAGARDGAAAPGTEAGAETAGRGAGGARGPGGKNARTAPADSGEPASAEAKKKGTGGKSAAKAAAGSAGKAILQGGRTAPGAEGGNAAAQGTDAPAATLTGGKAPAAAQAGAGDEAAETGSKESREKARVPETGKDPSYGKGSLESLLAGIPGYRAETASVGDKSLEDSPSGSREIARSGKRERNATIGVIDERSSPVAEAAKKADTGLETSVRETPGGSAEMTIAFRDDGQGGSGSIYRLSDGSGGKAQSFQDALTQQLKANAQDFVRAGQIVLRDNDSGTIRLNLHPESLGHVRINLELNDRKISGRIVVSSKEAYDAFRESLDGISQAFTESGFDSAGFDLSWSGGGAGDGSGDASGAMSSPFYASSIPDVMSGPVSSDIEKGAAFPRGFGAVNVYA